MSVPCPANSLAPRLSQSEAQCVCAPGYVGKDAQVPPSLRPLVRHSLPH